MRYYTVNHLEQDSDEWRLWRLKVIGSSDAPIIMGEKRIKGRENLADEKLGLRPTFKGNEYTQEGKRLEEPARKKLNDILSANLRPKVIQSMSSPYLAASIDGIDENKGILVEIKSGPRIYEHVLENKTVPNYYIPQLQHILMVANFDYLYFAAYRPNRELLVLKITASKPYIERLNSQEREFARELQKRGHKLQDRFLGRAFEKPRNVDFSLAKCLRECNRCEQKVRLPIGNLLDAKCPTCRSIFRVQTWAF